MTTTHLTALASSRRMAAAMVFAAVMTVAVAVGVRMMGVM